MTDSNNITDQNLARQLEKINETGRVVVEAFIRGYAGGVEAAKAELKGKELV